MRIVAGDLRGRRLVSPTGQQTRPTADRVRQALFNILNSAGIDFTQQLVLEGFAGTGALAFEALSRGAPAAVLIEVHRAACQAILANAHALGVADKIHLLQRDVLQLCRSHTAYSLIFLDPPYGKKLVPKALGVLESKGWLAPGATLVLEVGADEPLDLPPMYSLWQERTYGAARLCFGTYRP